MDIQYGLALDIDDTLSKTNVAIIEGLQKEFGNPSGMSPLEILKNFNHHTEISYWKTEIHETWKKELVGGNEFYENLLLIENANHFVNKIDGLIPISCYLTARPDNVIETTKVWLQKHGFPERPIIAKPQAIEFHAANAWKAKKLVEYASTIIGIVDDNSHLIAQLPESYTGTVFLYDQHGHHAYDQKTPINVVPCETWNHVYEKIISLRLQSQP